MSNSPLLAGAAASSGKDAKNERSSKESCREGREGASLLLRFPVHGPPKGGSASAEGKKLEPTLVGEKKKARTLRGKDLELQTCL